MSKIFVLKEDQFKKLVILISEDDRIDTFDEEDYIETFIKFYRKWIEERYGESKSTLPMSYLFKKYFDKFVEEYNLDDMNQSWRGTLRNMATIGRELIKKGKSHLQTLRPTQKFTSKFARPLEVFLKEMALPSYMSLKISEEIPYDVFVKIEIDWENMIKSEGRFLRYNTIREDFEKKLRNFLGIEFGNPVHGDLQMTFDRKPHYIGYENWVKQTLNKVIKKKIRELPNAKNIHRIKFEIDDYAIRAKMTLVFKDYTPNFGWNQKNELKQQVKDVLSGMGINTEIVEVNI